MWGGRLLHTSNTNPSKKIELPQCLCSSIMKGAFSNLMKWRKHILNECDKFATYREGKKKICLPMGNSELVD